MIFIESYAIPIIYVCLLTILILFVLCSSLYKAYTSKKHSENQVAILLKQTQNSLFQIKTQLNFDQQSLESKIIELSENKTKINLLENKIDSFQRNRSDLISQIAKTTTHNKYLEKTNIKNHEREQSLITQLDTLRSNYNSTINELTELQTKFNEKESNFAEQKQQFSETKSQLSLEFEQIANKIFTQKTQDFNQTSQQSKNHLLQPDRTQQVYLFHLKAFKNVSMKCTTKLKKVTLL